MKRSFHRNLREKKLLKGSFFSLFLLCAAFSVCSCSLFSQKEEPDQEKKIAARNLSRIFYLRKLRFAAAPAAESVLAEQALRAASVQLGLDFYFRKTSQEHLAPLVRAGKVELAYGSFTVKELTRFGFEARSILLTGRDGSKHVLLFAMPRGSAELWKLLKDAMGSSAENGQIPLLNGPKPRQTEEK